MDVSKTQSENIHFNSLAYIADAAVVKNALGEQVFARLAQAIKSRNALEESLVKINFTITVGQGDGTEH